MKPATGPDMSKMPQNDQRLVNRLRELSNPPYDSACFGGPMSRAANRIVELKQERDTALAEAAQHFTRACENGERLNAALAENARLREELEGLVIVGDQDGNGSPIWICELCDAFASETGTIRHTCVLKAKHD